MVRKSFYFEVDGIPFKRQPKEFIQYVQENYENTEWWDEKSKTKSGQRALNGENREYDFADILVSALAKAGRQAFKYYDDDKRKIELPINYDGERIKGKRRADLDVPLPSGIAPSSDHPGPEPSPTPDNLQGDNPKKGQRSPQEEWDHKAWGYEQDKPDFFDPKDYKDARERRDRSIIYRRGQPQFRGDLMKAYGERCAITDCDVTEALEACHIHPYNGDKTNHVTNGILLRADLHTLFDKKLFAIDVENKKVLIAPDLKGSSYDFLDGADVSLPTKEDCWPDRKALRMHRKEAQKTWG